jgi:hypothetical protein
MQEELSTLGKSANEVRKREYVKSNQISFSVINVN